MSLAPVDILEEDAADLQFPKENDIINIKPGQHTQRRVQHYKPPPPNEQSIFDCHHCDACQSTIREPYIKCAECEQTFCLQCFAHGCETQEHRNTHAYIIRHDNIRLFATSTWTAKDEKKLLDHILTYGYGNWGDIAKAMKTKSPQECRQHYLKYYFDGLFEKMVGLTSNPYFPERIPYMYKMNSVEPPRQAADSISFNSMAGYRCARGDFDVPYDNSAESIVSDLQLTIWDEESKDVGDALNCAMYKAYNNRLRERHRRYRIMREHGLLITSRTLSWFSKHSEALGCTTTGKVVSTDRFIAFMQLTSGIAFDLIVEAMQYSHDLKKYMYRLYELRKNGIHTFHGGRMYHKLRARRLSKIRDKRAEQYDSNWEWKQLVPSHFVGSTPNQLIPNCMINPAIKRKSTPLDILGLPAYDKLTEDEKQLCSTVRLVPSAYIGYKSILLSENSKSGYLRLADARRLIKIDVNKTRQVYDFLLKSGFISKPPN